MEIRDMHICTIHVFRYVYIKLKRQQVKSVTNKEVKITLALTIFISVLSFNCRHKIMWKYLKLMNSPFKGKATKYLCNKFIMIILFKGLEVRHNFKGETVGNPKAILLKCKSKKALDT